MVGNNAMPAVEQKFRQAAALQAAGRILECERLCRELVELAPNFVPARQLLGVTLAQQGRPVDGLIHIDAALALVPHSTSLKMTRGSLLQKQQRLSEALSAYDDVIAAAANTAPAWCSRASVLKQMGRLDEALESFNRGLTLDPRDVTGLNNRANILRKLGRHDEARTDYDNCLRLRPGQLAVLLNRANLLLNNLDLLAAAAQDFEAVLALDPRHEEARKGCVEARFREGAALLVQGHAVDAVAAFNAGLRHDPGNPELLEILGVAFGYLKRHGEAKSVFDAVLASDPGRSTTLNQRGVNFLEANCYEEALVDFDTALALNPAFRNARQNRAATLGNLGRHTEAIMDLEAILADEPDNPFAFGMLASAALHAGDWKRREACAAKLPQMIDQGHAIPPVTVLGYSDDPARLRRNAEAFMRLRPGAATKWPPRAPNKDRIRIAYLSADFRPHPVAHQIVDLIERHDRNNFEIIGIALGADTGTAIRARLESAFDKFYDVTSMSDDQAAELLHDLKVDIAVDLQGHTEGARPAILARRPASVQVAWLGYPGTTGADFIDYIIADPETAPMDYQPWFSERIVQLPVTYMPTDSKRPPVGAIPSRPEAGLPEQGFVFCSFNHSWKITPAIFEIWMRLLRDIPQSILWMRVENDIAGARFKDEAALRGIDPTRLVFAPRTATLEDHVARLALADLFLDTTPYAGHATTCDTLWAGVPVLTCRGGAFAGRVGAGLLTAIGLEELITDNLADYETLARDLAQNPGRLKELRRKLAENRLTHPLFDGDRFRRDIETAYTNMITLARKAET